MTKTVPVQEAASRIAELLALVRQGDEIIITDEGTIIARLVPPVAKPYRVFGQHRGEMWMSKDFNTPLPESFWMGGEEIRHS